jgi:hypothetical protein
MKLERIAALARDQRDVIHLSDLTAASVARIEESKNRVLEKERMLVTILENKPFGIPLTAQERNDLNSVKTEIEKFEKMK